MASLHNGPAANSHWMDEERRQERAETDHIAGLEWGGDVHRARVLDIAMTGARIETDAALKAGDGLVFASVRMGRRPAIVIWRDGSTAGLRFTDEDAAAAERRGLPPARHWLSHLRRHDGGDDGDGGDTNR
ncbi:MAG: PilZ domain-containing protein [Pseudomonadota bacterium]